MVNRSLARSVGGHGMREQQRDDFVPGGGGSPTPRARGAETRRRHASPAPPQKLSMSSHEGASRSGQRRNGLSSPRCVCARSPPSSPSSSCSPSARGRRPRRGTAFPARRRPGGVRPRRRPAGRDSEPCGADRRRHRAGAAARSSSSTRRSKPFISEDENLADAPRAHGPWGVGRAGFDDGLVLMISLDADLVHGKVELLRRLRLRASYLDEDALKRIIDDDFVPAAGPVTSTAAVLASLDAVQAATTPRAGRAAESRRASSTRSSASSCAPLALLLVAGVAYTDVAARGSTTPMSSTRRRSSWPARRPA